MKKKVIEINNLSKSFNKNLLFKNINLKLEEGKIYGFVGPNGCGKSVLFKIISGFILPDGGTIEVLGKRLGKDIDFPESTGILIESPGFLEEYSQYKNLEYLASIRNIIKKDDIIDSIKAVGLDVNNNKKVKQFSLGMRQRLGIAQAIMEKPKILILDEPFNGLDKRGVEIIKSLILELKEQGTTILITSHIDGDIESLADEIFIYNEQTLQKN